MTLTVASPSSKLAEDSRAAECHVALPLQATHIFDGLEAWPTHLMYLAGGRVQHCRPATEFPELQQGRLLELVERWLREEKALRKAAKAQQGSSGEEKHGIQMAEWSNGWAPGRMTPSRRDRSNTVMRM